MKYEKGKSYQFTNKQFNIGRDNNNRLIFIVPDPNTGGEYRILAFDYQNANIPERITCIFNGSRFEQDSLSAAATLYKPGDEVLFYVNSDVRNGRCTLRDEENDVTYKNIKVGKGIGIKRFDRILCRIDEITPTELLVTPIVERKKKNSRFTPDDVKQMPEGRYLRFNNLLERLLQDSHFADSAAQLEAGDNAWIVTFMEEVLGHTVEMIRQFKADQDRAREEKMPEGRWRKDYLLPGLESMAIALIERTDYVSKIPEERQDEIQGRLEEIIRNAGDYRRVYTLLICHEVDSTLHAILGSLKKSVRFYQPEEKVRLLNAMITLQATDVTRYMETLLDIIGEHHSTPAFMHNFKQGMQRIIGGYITDRQEHINRNDRNALRLLIRALATEQLLAGAEPDSEVKRHRGLLYSCAALLTNQPSNALATKAIQCFAGLVKCGPEFSWQELKDIQRLCYAYLEYPFGKNDLLDATAVFEHNGRCIEVTPGNITVASHPDLQHLKNALSYPLSQDMTIEFMTPGRISGFNADTTLENPLLQRAGFTDLRRLLNETEPDIPAVRNADLRLDVGDRIGIRVTGRRNDGFYECAIVDSAYTGTGLMGERDIVAYDINSNLDDFAPDGKPMVFNAVVKGILPDGTYQFTIRAAMNSYGHQQAIYDLDSDNEVTCVITGTYREGAGYYAVSENGYPMVVWLSPGTDYVLHRGDIVLAGITSVNSENDNLFVKGAYHDIIDPEDLAPGHHYNTDDIYRAALRGIATGTFVAEDSPAENVRKEVQRIELSPVNIHWMLRLINLISATGHQELGRRYSTVMIARIMADIADARKLCELYTLRADVLEELGNFAATARIDGARMRALVERAAEVRGKDVNLDITVELMRVLAGMDRPEEFHPGTYPPNSSLDKTSRMVTAYNHLQGMSLDNARREIIKGIYDLLELPQPKTIDVECLKVQEDERNEFKTSIIYPADNNMHADEFRQGRVIMEVVNGMLNRHGGVIYLGVNNQGVPVGLDNDFTFLNNNSDNYNLRDIEDKFSLHFHYYLRTQIGMTVDGRAVTDYVKLNFDILGGKVTARVNIEPFPGMVRMKDGKVFQRQDSSTIALPVSEQAAFAARRAAM